MQQVPGVLLGMGLVRRAGMGVHTESVLLQMGMGWKRVALVGPSLVLSAWLACCYVQVEQASWAAAHEQDRLGTVVGS